MTPEVFDASTAVARAAAVLDAAKALAAVYGFECHAWVAEDKMLLELRGPRAVPVVEVTAEQLQACIDWPAVNELASGERAGRARSRPRARRSGCDRMKYRRAGQPVGPVPLRARRAIERSPRSPRAPTRLGCIRGIVAIAEARRQTEPAWHEVWADEDVAKHHG